MTCRHSIAVLLVAVLVIPATTASAFDDDEMTFAPEDVQDDPADDDEMTFAPDDLAEDDFDPDDEMDESMDVGVVAVPNDDITDVQRDELQDALRAAADEIPEINTYGDADLLSRLEERGPDYCSRESLCLASVGESAGVQRILQVRVEPDNGTYRLDIDYFDVNDRLFVAYHSNSGLGDLDDVIEAIQPGVDDIFGIRRGVDDDPFVDDRDVDVVSVMAYSTAGAAVASLGTGILFGLSASGQEAEIEDARGDDGQFTGMTQREVHDLQRSMENTALTANVFYGLSAALAAASVGLFVLDAGGDEPIDGAERAVEFTPHIGGDRVGFGARLQF